MTWEVLCGSRTFTAYRLAGMFVNSLFGADAAGYLGADFVERFAAGDVERLQVRAGETAVGAFVIWQGEKLDEFTFGRNNEKTAFEFLDGFGVARRVSTARYPEITLRVALHTIGTAGGATVETH